MSNSPLTEPEQPSTQEEGLMDVRKAFFELMRAERRLRARDQHREPGELTSTQMRALLILREGETTAGDLAQALMCTPASVTGMVDQLEREGIVARRRSEQDRRVALISLAERGHEVLAARKAESMAMWREQLGDEIDEAELRGAARVMRAIAGMLDSQ